MVKEDNIYSTIELNKMSSNILNALSAHVCILNSDGIVVAFNKTWKQHIDEQQESWSHPHLKTSILKSLQAPLAEGNDFALRLLLGIKDVLSHQTDTFSTNFPYNTEGKQKWFKVTLNSLGYEDGAVLIYEDISDQTQNREYLRETKEKFEHHFHNSLYGILVADQNHVVIEANKFACNLLDITQEAIAYSNISNYIKVNIDVETIQKRINREGNFLGEHEIISAKGDKIPVELSVTLFRNEEGNPITSLAFKDISDKKITEQALKASEQQYKLQFNNTLEGIIIGRPNGLILEANPAACDMLGYKAEELEGKHRDIVFDLKNPINAAAISNRRKKGSFSGEVEFTHKNGSEIPVEVSSVIFEAEDNTEKTIINIKDISSRKVIEKQLLEEKEFTESAITSLPTAFFVIGKNGEMIRWNNILEQDLGYTHDEIASMNVKELMHPGDQEILSEILQRDFSGKKENMEVRCLTKDSKTLHYIIRGTSFKQNGKQYIVGGGLNRNDFKEIESQKKQNEELLSQLFLNSPIGIVHIDAKSNIQNVNSSFEKIFGYSKEELTGKNLDNIIIPEHLDDEAKSLSCLSFTGDSFQTESTRTTKEGVEIPVLIGGVPVQVDGKIIAIYGMYIDISERKDLENKIVELLETEQKARLHMQDMFEEAPSAIAMLEGEEHKYTFANDTYKKLVRKQNLIDKPIREVLPELNEQGFVDLLDTCYTEAKPFQFNEKEVYFNNGNKDRPNIHFLNFMFKPQRDDNGDVYGIFIEAVDVTEQVEARNIIEKSLAEKETLLNEVHHRVKNNLAIVSGLLELEMMGTEDENISKHLYSTQSRISTIAKIHELLYQNESLSHVSFNKYIESMVEKSGKLLNSKTQQLISNFELDEVVLNVNQAIPAGMLLNEIIDYLDDINQENSEGSENRLTLSLKSNGNCVSIKLEDSSGKLLQHFKNNENPTLDLRMELIDVLLKQIHGNLELTAGNEVQTLTIGFSKREAKGPHSALKN